MATTTREDYEREFEAEVPTEYPEIDRLEQGVGYQVNRAVLHRMARVLACPVKTNPACWQHGRVISAALFNYIRLRNPGGWLTLLDIGTAKGFSALCMQMTLAQIGIEDRASVVSVDVIDPLARVRRNTVAEVDGFKTLRETLDPFPAALAIKFLQATGINWLTTGNSRIHFAFIDGKHSYEAVSAELRLLARRQQYGDIAVLDDLQVPGVLQALQEAHHSYDWVVINARPEDERKHRPHAPRSYAIAARR